MIPNDYWGIGTKARTTNLHVRTYMHKHTYTHILSLFHTPTAHTLEDMFRHTHTRPTKYTEEGWIRQELNELRGRAKEVVESEGF